MEFQLRRSKDSLEIVEGENNNLSNQINKVLKDSKELKKELAEAKLEINHLKQQQKNIRENSESITMDLDNNYLLLESKYNLLISNFGKLEAIHKSCIRENKFLSDKEKLFLLQIEDQKKKLKEYNSEITELKISLKEEKENYDFCLNNLNSQEIENLNLKNSLKNLRVVKSDNRTIIKFPVITCLPIKKSEEIFMPEEDNISNDFSSSNSDRLINSLPFSLEKSETDKKPKYSNKIRYEHTLNVLERLFPYFFLFVFVFIFSQRFLFPVAV